MGSSQSNPDPNSQEPKPSLYQRYHNSKRGTISDEDIKKYTGKTRDELKEWADTQPGVGKNQLAGKISMGNTTGLGGMAAAQGYGGWGPSAGESGPNRGMKYPPTKPAGKVVDEEEDD